MGEGPSMTDFAMAAAMMHQEGRLVGPQTQVAGDVLPFTAQPNERTGPTNKSAPYAVGKETDDKVKALPIGTLKSWMERTSGRK